MVVDVHAHFHSYFPGHTPGDPLPGAKETDALITALRNMKVDKVCVNSSGTPPRHSEVIEFARRYPEVIVPIGYLRLGIDGPHDVDRLKAFGFRGLKVIRPAKSYDDPEYLAIYARAKALKLPVLFHTGTLAGSPQGSPGLNVSSVRMQFMSLDAIAREFPELPLIGAHLGVPSFAEAAWVARMHPNVYYDVCGPIMLPAKNPKFGHLAVDMIFQAIAASDTVDQLVFGSDNGPFSRPPGRAPPPLYTGAGPP